MLILFFWIWLNWWIKSEKVTSIFDEGDNCRIRQDAGTGWDEEDYKMFNGTYFDCTLSKAKLKDNSANVYMEIWTGKDYMKNNCVGSYITAMDEFLAQ